MAALAELFDTHWCNLGYDRLFHMMQFGVILGINSYLSSFYLNLV